MEKFYTLFIRVRLFKTFHIRVYLLLCFCILTFSIHVSTVAVYVVCIALSFCCVQLILPVLLTSLFVLV